MLVTMVGFFCRAGEDPASVLGGYYFTMTLVARPSTLTI